MLKYAKILVPSVGVYLVFISIVLKGYHLGFYTSTTSKIKEFYDN